MNHSTPGLPVHHKLPEFTQTHVHRVGDAIQPSHPVSSPSPPAPNPSQHQGLFQMSQLCTWGGQSIGVSASASVLPMNTQDWSPLGWTGWISLSKGLSRVFSKRPSILPAWTWPPVDSPPLGHHDCHLISMLLLALQVQESSLTSITGPSARPRLRSYSRKG